MNASDKLQEKKRLLTPLEFIEEMKKRIKEYPDKKKFHKNYKETD